MVELAIEKIVQKFELGDPEPDRQTREYWLSRPGAERFAMVDKLRKTFYGTPERLPRVIQKLEQARR